jgi:glycogen operon protein
VAAHDGFTLRDLVSFERKHNEANGEMNRDGTERDLSWNHGVEGASHDPLIEERRHRDVQPACHALRFAGTPMLSMGDEAGRTQNGNNNAYAQDNATTWLDWPAMDTDLVSFVATLTALRQAHPALHDDRWLRGGPVDASGIPDVEWRRADGRAMSGADWANPEGRVVVAALYRPASEGAAADHVAIALNASDGEVTIRWPDPRDGFQWRRTIDTARPAGTHDRCSAGENDTIAARSVVVLVEQAVSEPRRGSRGIEPEVLDRPAVQRHRAGMERCRAKTRGTTRVARCWRPWDSRRLLDWRGRRSLRRRRSPLCQHSGRAGCGGEGKEARVPIAVDDGKHPRHGLLHVHDEHGAERGVPFNFDDLPGDSIVAADGGTVSRHFVTLPLLAAGIYTVVSDDASRSACRLAVAPRACFLPAPCAMADAVSDSPRTCTRFAGGVTRALAISRRCARRAPPPRRPRRYLRAQSAACTVHRPRAGESTTPPIGVSSTRSTSTSRMFRTSRRLRKHDGS